MDNQTDSFNEENTLKTRTSDMAYNQFIAFWQTKRDIPNSVLDDNYKDLQKQVLLQEFSRNENSTRMLLDLVAFKILYVTDNVINFLGYSSEEVIKYNIVLLFRSLTVNHLDSILKMSQKGFDIQKAVAQSDYAQNLSVIVCGVKIRKRNLKEIQVLIKYAPTEFDENGFVKTALVTLEDVTHLLKSDFYWGRWNFGVQKECHFYFLSNKRAEFKKDIISDREKEILTLISEGKESQEIGNQLNISKETVNNHRKNMLARTGTRDTTALVQLAFSCNII